MNRSMTMTARADKPRDWTRWLGLAASPTFALMALVAAMDAPPLALCAAGTRVLPLDGMTAMYLLMSFFHLPPWLKLASRG
jgi:hypothetical protein